MPTGAAPDVADAGCPSVERGHTGHTLDLPLAGRHPRKAPPEHLEEP